MAPETKVPPKMQMRFDDWVQKPSRQYQFQNANSGTTQNLPQPPQAQQSRQVPQQQPQTQQPQRAPQQQRTPTQQQYSTPYPPPYPPPTPQTRPALAPPILHAMPHPSELLQQYQTQPPQQQLTPPAQPEADEWTHVQPKSKRKRKSVATQTEDQDKTAAAKARNPPSRSMTLAKIQSDFNTKMKAWQASECRKMTLSTLDRIAPDGDWAIEKAVCLGIGSFGRDNEECRKRSMWQFVIFVDLVRHLQRVGKRDIEMFGQEPMWVDVDGHFLKTLRLKVLAVDKPTETTEGTTGLGPAAEHLGPETFVFEPFLDMNEAMARQIVDADLGLYIGSSMSGLMSKWGAVGELAKQFDEQHLKYQFPPFEEDANVMEGMGIYWREEADDD